MSITAAQVASAAAFRLFLVDRCVFGALNCREGNKEGETDGAEDISSLAGEEKT